MQNHFTIAYIVSTVLCLLSAGMAWKRRNNPGNIPFALLMLALAIWSFATIFEVGAITVPEKIFWSKWQYLGITGVAPIWILFAAEYTGKEKFLTKSVRWIIWTISFMALFLVFTNESHGLFWTDVSILPGTVNIGYYERGIAFFIHTAFVYTCILIGTIWLIKHYLAGKRRQRLQSAIFIFGVIFSWLANAMYILRLLPKVEFDITPLSISFNALLVAWTIHRNQLFGLVPIARDALINSMNEGIIVIDPTDIILEINPAALKITEYQGPQPVGRPIWDVFSKYAEVIEQIGNTKEFRAEVNMSGDLDKVIEVQITTIDQGEKTTSGKMIIFRDITKRKEAEKIEKDQRDFAEALADTAAAVNSSLDLDNVLAEILENVAKVVPHDAANIALVTEEGKAKFVRVKNPERYGSMDTLLSLDINVLEMANFKKMAQTRKGVIEADTNKDSEWSTDIEDSKWIQSYLGSPILHQDTLLGFINLDSGTPGFFKPEHAEKIEIFANYAATALMNANLYSEIKFYAEQMAILYEISFVVASGEGLEKTTQAVYQQLKKILPIDLFYLALYEPKEKIASYFMYHKDGERIDIEPFYLAQKSSLTRYVMEKKKTVYIPDFKDKDVEIKEDQVIKVAGFDNRSILGIPLILRGEVIGVLSVQAADAHALDPNQIRMVETIAQQTSIALDNAMLLEKTQALAITDSLTGLYNRRYFYMILENEVERAKRYKSPLSLIMLDLDHFKLVNDKYGHIAGDELLQSFSKICQEPLRQIDNMFRIGGEEFIILLPETTEDEAFNVAERIRSSVEETKFKTSKGNVKITVSAGVSEYGENFLTHNEFVESVDAALYAAKNDGRNCIHVHSKNRTENTPPQ